MRKITAGEYQCIPNELIQVRFFCSPSRQNVFIRESLDGIHFSPVNTNSIQLMMGTSQITLSLQYAFISQGTCLNQILVVNNNPTTKDDRITTSGSGGSTDLITLIFKP
jgi:hypothetical protein